MPPEANPEPITDAASETARAAKSTVSSVDPRFRGATDCHVHLMPDRLMTAIRSSLNDIAGWEFPHPTDRAAMETHLQAHGVERYCALPYAHKPDIARDLNNWVLARADESTMLIPFATVHGEDDVRKVVTDAFEAGAQGLKFQCPVQQCGPADPRLAPAFELAAEYDRSVLFHAGTAPMFEDSPHVGVDQFRQFFESYPEVRACSAHMGTFEHEQFFEVLRDHENAFLDTCFAMSAAAPRSMDFDPTVVADDIFEEFTGRIMYGSDYPNIPHAYVDERSHLLSLDLSAQAFEALFSGAADRFLALE